jgi:hypothetical protein
VQAVQFAFVRSTRAQSARPLLVLVHKQRTWVLGGCF